jgi:hypothetical protein
MEYQLGILAGGKEDAKKGRIERNKEMENNKDFCA